ncbi:MAG: hypothetical protein HYU66_03355, partial [Armatimonadetes bacterium]|nr:hypothetical protein [Armatimonadota bacterium]
DGKKLLVFTNVAGRMDVTPPLSGEYAPKRDRDNAWFIEMRSPAAGQLDRIALERVEDRAQLAVSGTGATRTTDLGPGNYVLKVSGKVVGQIAVKP